MKKLGLIFGIVFILVGILGFVPNPLISPTGLFHTDSVHNVVHLVLGLILVLGSRKGDSAAGTSIKVVAAIYLVLAIVGFIQFGGADDMGRLAGLAMANSADNWLHLVLAVVLFASTAIAGKKSGPDATSANPQM